MPVVCGVAAVVSSSNHFLANFPEVSFLFPGWHLRDKNNCLEFGSKFPNIGQAVSYLWHWASFQSQFMIHNCLSLQVLPWPFDRTRVYNAPLLPFLPLLPPVCARMPTANPVSISMQIEPGVMWSEELLCPSVAIVRAGICIHTF